MCRSRKAADVPNINTNQWKRGTPNSPKSIHFFRHNGQLSIDVKDSKADDHKTSCVSEDVKGINMIMFDGLWHLTTNFHCARCPKMAFSGRWDFKYQSIIMITNFCLRAAILKRCVKESRTIGSVTLCERPPRTWAIVRLIVHASADWSSSAWSATLCSCARVESSLELSG